MIDSTTSPVLTGKGTPMLREILNKFLILHDVRGVIVLRVDGGIVESIKSGMEYDDAFKAAVSTLMVVQKPRLIILVTPPLSWYLWNFRNISSFSHPSKKSFFTGYCTEHGKYRQINQEMKKNKEDWLHSYETITGRKSLGWMQAPASWISSHTVRFIGVVRVVIQDGEGFILIKKGKPLFHYFKHGTIELKGHTAQDYFNSHPVIEFNLCKYTPDEFAWALKLCNIEDHEAMVPKKPAVSGTVSREHNTPPRTVDFTIAKPAGNKRVHDPVSSQVIMVKERAAVSGPLPRVNTPPSRPAYPPLATPAMDTRVLTGFTPGYYGERTSSCFRTSAQGKHPPSHPVDPPVAKPAGDTRVPDPVSPQVLTVKERAVVSGPLPGENTPPSRPVDHRSQSLPWTHESLTRFSPRFTR